MFYCTCPCYVKFMEAVSNNVITCLNPMGSPILSCPHTHTSSGGQPKSGIVGVAVAMFILFPPGKGTRWAICLLSSAPAILSGSVSGSGSKGHHKSHPCSTPPPPRNTPRPRVESRQCSQLVTYRMLACVARAGVGLVLAIRHGWYSHSRIGPTICVSHPLLLCSDSHYSYTCVIFMPH